MKNIKKLLVLVTILASAHIFADNNLPNGNYSGDLITPKGYDVKGHGNATPAANAQSTALDIALEAMPDLGNNTGTLTATINGANEQSDCFNQTGKLTLDKPFLGIKQLNVTAVCTTADQNAVVGTYRAQVGVINLNGSFNFAHVATKAVKSDN